MIQLKRHHVTTDLCQSRFWYFFQRAWHVLEPARPLHENWHLEYLCDIAEMEVERIAQKRQKDHDYLINVPFRSGKSQVFSVMLQPWVWTKYPWMTFVTSSNAHPLALKHSRSSQKLMESDWYQKHFGHMFKLKSTSGERTLMVESKSYFENNKGGFRFVTSVGGSVIGYGGDVNILDDPLSAKQAKSKAEKKRANQYWGEDFKSRVTDFNLSVFFLIMQRLDADDPTGHSLAKEQESGEKAYFHIVIPAEEGDNIKPKALKQYYQDGLFDPVRFNRRVVQRMKNPATGLGEKAFQTQANQVATSGSGNILKNKWFKGQILSPSQMPKMKKFQRVFDYWDTAHTKNEENSATAFVRFGLLDGNLYVLDFGYKWIEFPDQLKWIGSHAQIAVPKIEKKSTGQDILPILKQKGVTALEVKLETGDKVQRTNLASPHVEAGRVFLSSKIAHKLLHDPVQGILKHPEGHNDVGDCFVNGILDLLGIPKIFDSEFLEDIIEEESSHIF